jgi:zinc protease
MWAQVARIKSELPGEEELARAFKQAKAHLAFSSESVTNQALWLGFAEMVTDCAWFTTFVDQLNRVTAEDVRRVADRYLDLRNCTVGWYVPDESTRAMSAGLQKSSGVTDVG